MLNNKRRKHTKMNKAPLVNNNKTLFSGPKQVYKYYNDDDDETKNKNPKRCMCIDYQDPNDFNIYHRCSKKAEKGSDFCDKHKNCVSYLRNFLSGSEPEYEPKLWSDPYVEGSHNCYSYFLNRQVRAVKEKCEEICLKKNKKGCPKKDSECSDLKPQPGDASMLIKNGNLDDKERIYKCPNMINKIMDDNKDVFPVAFNQKCPKGYYKGLVVVDSGIRNGKNLSNEGKGKGSTYHFYRQDKSGLFSHKPGISPVSDVDASGKKIYVPHFANRDYRNDPEDVDELYYDEVCPYLCVPNNYIVHKNLA